MKKIAILGGLLFILGEFASASVNCFTSGPDTNKEVKIEVVIIDGGNPRPRPRSEEPIISAELSGDQLSFDFDEQLGPVTISVENSMGEIVSFGECDTDYVPFVVLNVPTNTEDVYNISIIGESIEATGAYDTFR